MQLGIGHGSLGFRGKHVEAGSSWKIQVRYVICMYLS